MIRVLRPFVSSSPVRPGAVVAAIAALAAVAASLVPADAAAGIRGPCSAWVKGRSVAGLTLSRSAAIRVGRDSAVAVSIAAPREMTRYKITITYAGRTWTIKDATISSNRWTGLVPVSRYARYGTGYYTVRGTGTGPGLSCSGEALIKVV